MPPIIGAAIRFITSAPAPDDHMMGTRPMNIVATVMNFGRMRLTAPWRMALLEVARGLQPSLASGVLVREVEVQQHEDAGLGVDAQQRDEADPDADAHVVAERVEQPDGADGGERARPA